MLLREKDKQALCKIFSETLNSDIEVIAFGSRVNGKAHDTSDLDLVIRNSNQQKLNINEFMKIKEKIQNSNIPIVVQILDWYRIPKSFHKHILENYEILKF